MLEVGEHEVARRRAREERFKACGRYVWTWFEPETGRCQRPVAITADSAGTLAAPSFTAGADKATRDVAAKIVAAPLRPGS